MLFNGGVVPSYIMYTQVFHMKNSILALLIPTLLFNGFYIILYKNNFASNIHPALVEAAKIDGAGHFRTCWQIVIPMVISTIVTLIILNFNSIWNDYFIPYVFVSKWEKMTVPLGVAAMKGYMGSGNKSVVLAGVTVALLPILIVFLIGQKYIVEGLTASSVKG